MAKDPKLPSAADIELHEPVHVPYGDRCKWCNMGRGRGMLHTHSRGPSVPIVGVACSFMTGDGLKKRKGLTFLAPRRARRSFWKHDAVEG